jgi:transcriptional regulator with XRE-family HTH domain
VTKLDARTLAGLVDLGAQIAAVRTSKGITRSEIARRVRMQRSNYVRIEKGEKNVTYDTLLRIADGLGVELRVVLGDA